MLLNNTPINVGMNFGVRCGAQAGARCRHEHNMVTHAQRSDTVWYYPDNVETHY